jgi:hypothetical protein
MIAFAATVMTDCLMLLLMSALMIVSIGSRPKCYHSPEKVAMPFHAQYAQ